MRVPYYIYNAPIQCTWCIIFHWISSHGQWTSENTKYTQNLILLLPFYNEIQGWCDAVLLRGSLSAFLRYFLVTLKLVVLVAYHFIKYAHINISYHHTLILLFIGEFLKHIRLLFLYPTYQSIKPTNYFGIILSWV